MRLRDEYLEKTDGKVLVAATLFAEDLMRSDPEQFKAGYARENAIIASVEVFGSMQIACEALRIAIREP